MTHSHLPSPFDSHMYAQREWRFEDVVKLSSKYVPYFPGADREEFLGRLISRDFLQAYWCATPVERVHHTCKRTGCTMH